ncbi:hypothetical protein N183_33090 [Sinorhizobium sp. Sb3]|nr:hypothetical protein N183_33090 [Sinorhizobium sp. Sb3]
MVVDHGSVEGWQRAKTIEWMIRLAQIADTRRMVILEGQTRLSFLEEGASAAG